MLFLLKSPSLRNTLFAVIVFSFLDISTSDGEATLSVGKLRSSAEVAYSKGEIEQAIKLWNQVVDLEPTNEQNFYKRFRVYLRLQKYKEALADLNAALLLKPDFDNALAQRGRLQLRMGRCVEAEKDLLELQRKNPTGKDVELLKDATICVGALKEGENAFNRRDWNRAREHYSNAIRYAETAPQIMLQRAWCSYRMGDLYEAISDTGKVLRLEADNLPALELRGSSYYVLGEFEMAMNHYRSGLKLDPEHSGCKGGYRLIKKINGYVDKAAKATASRDFHGAVKQLSSLLEVDPEHRTIIPKTSLELCEAYRQLKMYDEAKASVKK
eukprot:gene38562-50643_t